MLRSLIISLMVVGLMSMSAGVVLADSDEGDGNATSTDDGLDPSATSTDPGLDPNATSTDPSLDPNATSTTGYDDGGRKGFVGMIYSLATSTVGTSTVVTGVNLAQNGTNELVYISFGEDVEVKLPGGPNAWASLEDAIAGNAEVVILSRQGEDGNDAIFVLVKPKRPSFIPLVGTAIATEDGVTTIVLPNGKTKKIKQPEGEDDPEDGEVVTVFVDNTGDGDAGGEGDDGAEEDGGEPVTVKGLVKASAVADRIQFFLTKLAEDDGSLPQAAVDARQRMVSRLSAVLEKHSAQHVSIIEKVSKAQGLGSGTASGIQRALEKAQAGHAKGKAIADDAKSKVGLGQNAGKGPKNIFGPNNSGDDSDDDGDGSGSGGSGKPDGSGKPTNAGSQGSNKGNKGNSGG